MMSFLNQLKFGYIEKVVVSASAYMCGGSKWGGGGIVFHDKTVSNKGFNQL